MFDKIHDKGDHFISIIFESKINTYFEKLFEAIGFRQGLENKFGMNNRIDYIAFLNSFPQTYRVIQGKL